jgi:hypothetical protein
MSQVIKKGPWSEERMLGSGGFGAVTLWKNEVYTAHTELSLILFFNKTIFQHCTRNLNHIIYTDIYSYIDFCFSKELW